MKIKIIIFYLLISSLSFSQSLEVGAGVGTGSTYIVENSDKSVNINYKTPSSIYTDLKYIPSNSNIGVMLRYQYTNTSVNGQKWFEVNQNFNAIVGDNSLFLLIEYIKTNEQKVSFGGNAGLGYTKQTINFTDENYSIENSFPSVNISGIVNYRFSNKFSIKLQPTFQFFDPISGMKIKQYNFAKEDIHFFALLGVSYKL